MANYYVWSGATGAGTGADWTNAYTTLEGAVAGKAAGDVFFVAHDHVQTAAVAVTIAFPGTEAVPNQVYCVNRAGSVPPVSADLRTTGQIATTLASTISVTGSGKINGLIFSAGSGANAASLTLGATTARSFKFANCTFILGNTSTSSRIQFGAAAAICLLDNCTMQFGAVAQGAVAMGRAYWRNTPNAIVGATIPTSVFLVSTATTICLIEGVDLSAAGAGKSLVGVAVSASSNFTFKDCKLGSGVAVTSGAYTAMGAIEVTLLRCDSGATNYRAEYHNYEGVQTMETTIVRSGGASDGVTPISWKIVTSANSEWDVPFEALPISIWNETVDSPVGVTIQGIWAGGAVPLNTDIWLDVHYLGTVGFPLALKVTTTKSNGLESGSNIPSGSGVWGGAGTQFAMSVTFTPRLKGPVTIYVNAAKPSSTFYIDPKPIVT